MDGPGKDLAGLYLSAAPRIRVTRFHSDAGVMTYRTTMDCFGALLFMTCLDLALGRILCVALPAVFVSSFCSNTPLLFIKS